MIGMYLGVIGRHRTNFGSYLVPNRSDDNRVLMVWALVCSLFRLSMGCYCPLFPKSLRIL